MSHEATTQAPAYDLSTLTHALFQRRHAVASFIGCMAILKLIAVFIYVPASASIFDLGFSFDPYVRSLYEGRGFVSCIEQGCDHSSRMPGIPYFLYALSSFTTSLRVADLIKVVLLSGLVYLACRGLPERLTAQKPLHWALYLGLAAFIVFAPNLIKHAASAHYEEGYNLEILAIAAIGMLTLLISAPKEAKAWRYAMPIIAASAAYLFKSSMIMVWLAVALVVVFTAIASGRRLLGLGLVALALAAPVSWFAHNYATGNRLSVMSSYDGENMFRGWNARTLAVYPHCSLDILFARIGVCMGKPIDLPEEKGREGFASEWAWNDDYKKRAMDWIVQHPAEAVKTLGVKFYTVLLSPRLSPYRLTDGVSEKARKLPEEIFGTIWLSIGRVLEILALATGLYLIVRGDAQARRVGTASLMIIAGYAAPYVLGYGYERHFSLLVMLAAVCDLFLFSEFIRSRAREKGV